MVAALEPATQRHVITTFDAGQQARAPRPLRFRSRAADCYAIRACSPELSVFRLEKAADWFVRIYQASCDARRDTWSFSELYEALRRRWCSTMRSPRTLSYHIASAVKAGAIERLHGQIHLPHIRAQQAAFGMPQRWVTWMPPSSVLLRRRENARLKKARQRARVRDAAIGGGDSCNPLQNAPRKMPQNSPSGPSCNVSPPLLEPPLQRRALDTTAQAAFVPSKRRKPSKSCAPVAQLTAPKAEHPLAQAEAPAAAGGRQASASAATARNGDALGRRENAAAQDSCHSKDTSSCSTKTPEEMPRMPSDSPTLNPHNAPKTDVDRMQKKPIGFEEQHPPGGVRTKFARLKPSSDQQTDSKATGEELPSWLRAIEARMASTRAVREARCDAEDVRRKAAAAAAMQFPDPASEPALLAQPRQQQTHPSPSSRTGPMTSASTLSSKILSGSLKAPRAGYTAVEAHPKPTPQTALAALWQASDDKPTLQSLARLQRVMPELRPAAALSVCDAHDIRLCHLAAALKARSEEAPGRAVSQAALLLGIARRRRLSHGSGGPKKQP